MGYLDPFEKMGATFPMSNPVLDHGVGYKGISPHSGRNSGE